MEAKKLIVAVIKNGTVIDHIPAGQGLRIVKLLNLDKHKKQVALGLNLSSKTLKHKDLIKVEERELTSEEVNQVAILAPQATISIIEESKIVRKFHVSIPETLAGIIHCPNQQCISNHEKIVSLFLIKQKAKRNLLCCKYCRKTFYEHEINK